MTLAVVGTQPLPGDQVLAGMRVPADQESDFEAFLTSLNYPYKDETENPVFKKHIF